MAALGSDRTDVYTLSMSYDPTGIGRGQLKNGTFGLAARDSDGNWINAVDMNYGGSAQFIYGPWDASYKLGTYGIDPDTHTAWAVINYNGDFAVSENIDKRLEQICKRMKTIVQEARPIVLIAWINVFVSPTMIVDLVKMLSGGGTVFSMSETMGEVSQTLAPTL
jgi:hypothetical protein